MSMELRQKKFLATLVIGDALTILVVTILGFASHGTLDSAGIRLLTTFFPLLIGWLAVAPFFGLFTQEYTFNRKQLWRPVYVMLIIAPLASWLRAVMLGAPILPQFVAIIGLFSALAMFLWRAAFLYYQSRLQR